MPEGVVCSSALNQEQNTNKKENQEQNTNLKANHPCRVVIRD
jgi:hypothetical protein